MDEDFSTIQIVAGEGTVAQVKAFMDAGVSVNNQDDFGYAPLHAAASYGNKEVVTFLLANGASVQIQDSDGDTPLHACEDAACAGMLLAAGADLLAANKIGDVPYVIAVKDEREEMIAWFKAQYAARGLELPEVVLSECDDSDEEKMRAIIEEDTDEDGAGPQEDEDDDEGEGMGAGAGAGGRKAV